MKHEPELTVMLTYDDRTVRDAAQVFEQCKDTKATYWGFKEEGLPVEQMKALFAHMKECGKKTVLEVVAYTEQECMAGARLAADCGCDILMGTVFFDSVNAFCHEHDIRYMPFVGHVHERPSVLDGDIDEILKEAKLCIEKGAYGVDLLVYRYTGDRKQLLRAFAEQIDAPVCIAGSVNDYERIDEILHAGLDSFTVGSAFFDHNFEGSFAEQIDKVCEHIHEVSAKEEQPV
ncbi:MAG: hypothetical protein E7523_05430 [Ruminococcaceae bacterium]|nr:hypothetical protein [Oscillospiraceae bacterium]